MFEFYVYIFLINRYFEFLMLPHFMMNKPKTISQLSQMLHNFLLRRKPCGIYNIRNRCSLDRLY